VPGWHPTGIGLLYQLRQTPLETKRLVEIWDSYVMADVDEKRLQEDFFLRELVRNYAAARGNLAQELARRGRHELALQEADRALALDSTFYGAHLSRGNIYFQMGAYPQAAEAFLRAHHLSPERLDIIHNMALTHLRTGQHERAIQLYQNSISQDSLRAGTYNDLGLAYKQAGLYQEAIEAYRRAMNLEDSYADPWRNLGVIYAYHQLNYSRAVELWEHYLMLRPEDPEADMIRAEVERMRKVLGE
jgi:tetratricopeptide (TPR) repeat protein